MRTITRGRSPAALRGAVAIALITLLGSCKGSEHRQDASAAAQAASASEFAIPHPPLDDMEPAVAKALETQRSHLDAMLAREGTADHELGRVFGELGRMYQAHRLLEAAEACYRAARRLAPDTFEWAYLSGVLTARRGDLEGAIAALEAAVELRPRDVPALVRLADLELDREKADRAGVLYQQAVALDPTLAAAQFGLGRVAAAERRYPNAIEHFERAIELQPRASVVHYHLGQAYRQLGRIDDAERELAQSGPVKVAIPDPLMSAVNALVESASPFMIQGNTALRDGRITVAANAFRRAVEADPANVMARQSLATVLTLLRDLDGAVEQLEVVADLAPDNAQALSDLGAALAELGQDRRAVALFRRAVELEPTRQQTQLNLANTLARLGRLGEAERHYRLVLEIDSEDPVARSRLATVLGQQGKHREAVRELRRVLKQGGGDEEVYFNLGVALAGTGDLEEASAQYRRVLALTEDDAIRGRAYASLGALALRENDRREALKQFQLAIEARDDMPQAHNTVANLLAASGRYEEALVHFVRLRELAPEQQVSRLGEATVLMALGRFGEAKTALEDAIWRAPEETATQHALARLLAAAPDPSLRDGERSLVLTSKVLEAAILPSYVETLAMALAEVGRFEEAVARQRSVLEEVRKQSRSAAVQRLTRNLSRYEEGAACCADPRDVLPGS